MFFPRPPNLNFESLVFVWIDAELCKEILRIRKALNEIYKIYILLHR